MCIKRLFCKIVPANINNNRGGVFKGTPFHIKLCIRVLAYRAEKKFLKKKVKIPRNITDPPLHTLTEVSM